MYDRETGVPAICRYTGATREDVERALASGELGGAGSPPGVTRAGLDLWLRTRAVAELLLVGAQVRDQRVDGVADGEQLA